MAAGWDRPNRGPWRRKREVVMCMPAPQAERRLIDIWDAEAFQAAGGAVTPMMAPKEGKPDPRAVATYLADRLTAVDLYGDRCRRVVQRMTELQPRVRAVLYMAAMAAIRSNPPIRSFYRGLVGRGKARMVALVACMWKLIVTLNAMLRHQAKWQPPVAV